MNNKGYSLVELIAVISIMVILVGVLSMSISIIYSRDAEAVAKVINDEITEVRELSMTKDGEYRLIVNCSSAGNHADKAGISKTNFIEIKNGATSLKKVEFSRDAYISFGEEDSIPACTDTEVSIEFNKTNGSVSKINDTDMTVAKCYVFKCQAVRNTNKIKYVDLMTITGHHDIR